MAIEKIVYVDGVTIIRAEQLNAWQDELIRLNNVKYEKPADGIPKSDLAAALQTLLDKAQDVEEAAERGDFDGEDGVSPTITVEDITGGHRVTITDAEHPQGLPFDVLDGSDGSPGATPDLQIGTVETGEPGSAAEASITGTPEEPLLNLKLPRGQQGPAVPLSDQLPSMNGNASAGTGTSAARADHVHPTDTSRASAATLATYARPNLLDNAYFVGGGSQLGYGIFPINQRGQTVYQTAGAYTIDRWKLNSGGSNLSATLNSDGVTLASGNAQGDWCLIQELTVSPLLGKTVTASIKVESVNGRGYIHLYVNPTISLGAVDITSAGVYSVTLTVPINTTRIRFVIGAPTSMVVSACKVEIGNTQTLAHQENGAWVLNEIPIFSDELTKCRRYFRRLTAGNIVYNYTLCGCCTNAGRDLLVALPDGTPMAVEKPSVTISGSIIARGIGGYIANPSATTLTCSEGRAFAYGVSMAFQQTDGAVWSGVENNTPVQVNLSPNTIIDISAE